MGENQGQSSTSHTKGFRRGAGWKVPLHGSSVNTHVHPCILWSGVHYIKDNSSHVPTSFTSGSLVALKCCFTKPLCEINVILYSAFEVITPSVEIICEGAESLNCYWKLQMRRPRGFSSPLHFLSAVCCISQWRDM